MRAGPGLTIGVMILALALASMPARAQENVNPDQMRRMYEDAVAQLKTAQERKNQLAAENEKLQEQVTAMQKDLAANNARMEEFRRADAESAERSFFLRSHYMAWQQFTRGDSELLGRWRAFIRNDYYVAPLSATEIRDPDWPVSLRMAMLPPPAIPVSATQPATQPGATQPGATQPVATQPADTKPATNEPTTQPTGTTQPSGAGATQPAIPVAGDILNHPVVDIARRRNAR